MSARTMLTKIWDEHRVLSVQGHDLLYVDLHLVHEVSSPQAFEALRGRGQRVRRPDLTLATVDHGVPTAGRALGVSDPLARRQVDELVRNCERAGIRLYGLRDRRQGIVHVVGPEQGLTQPGMTIVCGDSHTTTHGAFGALAFGIGTSEIEHVLATQTLWQAKPRAMRITIDGEPPPGVTAKDVALGIVARLGTGGAADHAIEYGGSTVRGLSMEGRMTLCNMSIEAGAKAALIAPDDTTLRYLTGRPGSPRGTAWDDATEAWAALPSDEGAIFDRTLTVDATALEPYVTWGTNPAQAAPITSTVPSPDDLDSPSAREAAHRALAYMDLRPGTPLTDIRIDRVFLGSCTNSRIEDLRAAAAVLDGRRVAPWVSAMVVPGSGLVKAQAEREGLDRVFRAAGFEWRDAGCSMCVAMNPDTLAPGERCASTSNRNFENRQGTGGRTHLLGPAMAAAAAVRGHLTDVRSWLGPEPN